MKWLEHNNALYNLDRYCQICRGDDDEILLVDVNHNEDWNDCEECIASLKYKSREEREMAFERIRNKLEVFG